MIYGEQIMRTISKELYKDLALTFYEQPHRHVHDLKRGLLEEAQEVVDATGRENFIEELGDVLWYITVLADNADLSLDEIMLANINKLERRVLNGKTPKEV